jgi:hypothetical protein
VGTAERKKSLGRSRHRREHNIKMDLSGMRWDGKDRADLAQDRDQWRAFVNTVMNLRFCKMLVNSSVAERLEGSQEGLGSMELVSILFLCLCSHCFTSSTLPRAAKAPLK